MLELVHCDTPDVVAVASESVREVGVRRTARRSTELVPTLHWIADGDRSYHKSDDARRHEGGADRERAPPRRCLSERNAAVDECNDRTDDEEPRGTDEHGAPRGDHCRPNALVELEGREDVEDR